eukprot:3698996-Alexandrium_andersonii.AAC.1
MACLGDGQQRATNARAPPVIPRPRPEAPFHARTSATGRSSKADPERPAISELVHPRCGV